MNQCLVTRLKSSVDNPDLPVFAELRLNTQATKAVRITFNSSPVTVKVVSGSGIIENYSSDPYMSVADDGKSATFNQADHLFAFRTTTDCVIGFVSKYDIKSINGGISPSVFSLNINDLNYCTLLEEIYPSQGDIITNSYGNIEDLGRLINLELFRFPNNPNITGKVERLVESLIANGSADSHVLTTQLNGTACTLHNASIGGQRNINITSTGATVTVTSSSALVATYVKATNTWTYE